MRIISTSILLLFFLGCFSSSSSAQDLYNTSTIAEIEIDFYQANWDALLDSYMAADSDERILADVTINGVVFDSAGVRYKGNSSYSDRRTKNPLNIKLNYVKDQDYDGYYTLKLSNGFKDPTFVREVLAYEISQKYMPTPLAAYANITINGSYIGLYTNVQSVNDVFTKAHYYSEDRPFFEGAGDGPRPQGCEYVNWAYMGTDSTNCLTYYYDSKSGAYYSKLINFLDIFNNDPGNMEEVYDVDRHLWAMAFDIGLVNLDAPISMAHNFYLYYDNNERFNYIKWDLNECFGVFQRLGNTQLNTYQMQQLDPFTSNNTSNPIVYKVWGNDRWKKMYLAHLITLIEENINSNWYMERAEELQSVIDAAVQNDPNKFYSYSEFSYNLNNTVDRTVGISELMNARSTYLANTSYFQYSQPQISNLSTSPEMISPGSDVTITAEISDANYAYAAYRSTLGGRFEKIEMFDDGAHNDGSSGDGIWGASIPVNNSYIDYYIYAENEDAGIFSPERAEYEFYSLRTANDIVINEFMASNSQCVGDQDDEYDDWIELYNNTDDPVSLNGYSLSDDTAFPEKWQFPDTTIAAGSYLIIWADKDTLQAGLHANFKLSANGEAIILSNASGIMIDQVDFPSQTTDFSYGRYLNGIGNFEKMVPTFSKENKLYTKGGIDAQIHIPEIVIYPNPARTMVNIRIEDELEHNVMIFNVYGQMLGQWDIRNTSTIDVSHLNPGFYFLNIDHLSSEKFIIQ